ncbi:MAG: N-methyl-L-tryptophan oxidase [Candidatus Thermofonsia Clade 1 bacterium]|jgi:monomeric sarcosine oxidase|uniref:N-methyl-L-tryptophan oxidase n=1 Tax=Candidatus Thermofonsia Clade 1 bacterium TaxID=2364210 RepID=A0A2M8PF01_9CHLR|nr:MAG: N-methyl-L-tryptophan oxidase [Candidatus Thermofonsia Clade 1 bacterium]RMF49090.1 MAG: N-methyl-L-tryptophan oxidase [Chloroflexota bacterium]
MSNLYDAIVVGLGVMGSAAAYHLAKAGQRVLALEQFALDHRLGSSHGESRIIRYAYTHPLYVEMAYEAFALWRALEQASGKRLMVRTGGFDFGRPEAPTLQETRRTLEAAGIPFEWLNAAEAARRFPQFSLAADMVALYQHDAAYLAASACVLAQAELAHIHGAELLTETPVRRIEPLHDAVRVYTAERVYEAGKLILTGGPWMGKLLSALDLRLPLQPTREQIVFFEPRDGARFTPEHCPVFIFHSPTWFYGLPNVDGSGVKVGVHCNNEPCDPDQVKRTPDEAYIQRVRDWTRQYLPAAAGEVKEARVCLYTMTPDEHFIIDAHPAYPQIIFGAGFSGHGFKFGNLVGRLLADMVLGNPIGYDLSLFSATRFVQSA